MTSAPPPWQVIRRASFKRSPWKNGGGVTHEAIRVPPQGDAFLWRVSVAEIAASGPFSEFAAYNRTMVLLKGDGMELELANGQQRILRRVGELAEFDGGLAAHCRLLGGPCVDLNLMVAKNKPMIAHVDSLHRDVEVQATQDESQVIFAIDASLNLDGGGEHARLEPWDLAVISNRAVRVTCAPRNPPATAAVFFATIPH